MNESIRSVRIGALFAILTILFGFGLGITFGVADDDIEEHLEASAKSVLETKYEGNKKKMRHIAHKSWRYIQRAHFHAGGIGAATLSLILLLGFTGTSANIKGIVSMITGIGAFGYPFGWLLAGFKAPALGSMHLAKEAVSWIAAPAGLAVVLGSIAILILFVIDTFVKKKA